MFQRASGGALGGSDDRWAHTGVGEIKFTGVGAAAARAIYNAIGTRLRELPITLDKLMAA